MTLIIALLLAVCLPHEPSLGKKPPKPPPEPPTPPVQYSIQFFCAPNGSTGALGVSDMNDVGCVVGRYFCSETSRYHGYVYNHPEFAGVHDLNDIVSGLPNDNPDEDDVPDWHIRNANEVNFWGDIVGSIHPNDGPDDVHRACFIDMKVDPPQLMLIDLDYPDGEFGTYTVAHSINIFGEISGHVRRDGIYEAFLSYPELYTTGLGPIDLGIVAHHPQINDSLEIAGSKSSGEGRDQVFTPVRYQLWRDGTWEGGPLGGLIYDSRATVEDINNNGIVVGRASAPVGKGKKTTLAVYRYDTEPDYVIGDYTPNPTGINDNGDFVNIHGSIYLDKPPAAPDGERYYFVDDLIDRADPYADVWFSHEGVRLYALSNRAGIGGFGKIAGTINVDSGELGFMLTPN